MSGVVRGEAARARVVRLSVVGQITRGPEGDSIAARLVEDGRTVASERWVRPGPAAIEIVGVTGGARFEPKEGPLAITFRVKNRPVAVRFRAELAGERVVDFYEEQVPPARRLPGRIALVERDGPELEPGEHTLEWDGRDDTPARRIAQAGQCTLVLEDARRPQVRAERLVVVAPPVVRYLGPRWPRRVDAEGAETDPGRDRRPAFRIASEGFRALGFANTDAANRAEVSAQDVIDALSSSAAVVVATHGAPESLALYVGRDDPTEREDHVVRLEEHDLFRLDREARRTGAPRPLRDARIVLLWACMAGSAVPRDPATHAPRAPTSIFVGLPARLRACGVDIVVAFTQSIVASEHQDFLSRLLADLLERRSIGEASRAAADAADARAWGNRALDEAKRAEGMAPLREALTIFPPDTQTDRERLDPACWGISTN